jgi:hypothetical protein
LSTAENDFSPIRPFSYNGLLVSREFRQLLLITDAALDVIPSEPRRRGRPPLFQLQKQNRILREIHVKVGADVWDAVQEYCETIGELSLSLAVRQLVRERLSELGYLKDRTRQASPTKMP